MFTRIGTFLPETLKSTGLEPHVQRGRLFEIVAGMCRDILPTELWETFRVASLTDATLTIACKTSACAYALKGHESRFLAALHEQCADLPCKRMRFMLTTWS